MSSTPTGSRPWRFVVSTTLCLATLFGGSLPMAAAQNTNDTDDLDHQIDVLTATREEVRRALAKLDQEHATQRAAVERAEDDARAAADEVRRAEARVALAEHEVEMARQTVAEYAVEAYMNPPAKDSLRVLSLSRADDASYASTVIQILTEERHKVVDVLVAKQAEADRQREEAAAAAERARDAASKEQIQLVELDRMRAEQQRLGANLDERLDSALAEAAALAAIDKQIADELAAQELALRDAGPPSPPRATMVTTPPSTSPSTAPATTSPPRSTVPSPRPTTPRPTTPPTTKPPAPPTGIVTWDDVTRVGGIWVHKSIAGNVRALLDAASAAGLNLGGGGYRDPQSQIDTRRNNCGPTHYDIYEKPASQCTPPTAQPGKSMHERGLAIDFTSNGSLITSRSNPAFVWLANNAARYGLYNLPSEPWHWSTNGH